MPPPDPDAWAELLAHQENAVTVRQAREHGYSTDALEAQLAARRWQRPAPAVYVTFTGPLPAPTRQWVALLYAGNGAVLSHETAADLWGLRPADEASAIHVSVPATRKVRAREGLVVHRSRSLDRSIHPARTPPRTTLEATIFDLAALALRLDDARALVAKAGQLGLSNSARMLDELARRRTQKWRPALLEAINGVAAGAHSVLELHYLRDVETAHRLPVGRRQRKVVGTRQDVFYDEFATVVELDGLLGHADDESRWRDMTRDNAAAARAELTLRYGWTDVRSRPCEVATQVAAVLQQRGWTGSPAKCGNCAGP
jgi:hypothetical protein